MNLSGLWSNMIGLIFILFFLGLIIIFRLVLKDQMQRGLRDIPAFTRLRRAIGLSVESGRRLHISLGEGGIQNLAGAAGLLGLSVIQRISRSAAISDRPPVATSGEPNLAILSQDAMRSGYREVNAEDQYNPDSGQLTGLTPFSYAAGVLPVVFGDQNYANLMLGSFGTEAALISDAGERTESLTIGGSENLNAQAIFVAATQEPLIGEELFAAGAYLQIGKSHEASLLAQDVLRWIIILLLLVGGAFKLAGLF